MLRTGRLQPNICTAALRRSLFSAPRHARGAHLKKTFVGFTTLLLAFGLLSVLSSAYAVNPATVNLASAETYSVLGGTGITNTATTTLSGDLGLSPSGTIAGFGPGAGTVTGTINDKNAAAAQAQTDAVVAYNNAAARTADSTFSGVQNGVTFVAGVHSAGTAISLIGTMTLNGQNNPNAVFIFKVDAALNTAAASNVILINGAQAGNVFWQVNGAVTIGVGAAFSGTLMVNGAVTIGDGASLNGRALSNGLVMLSTNTITTTSPTTVPGAPTGVSATPGNTQAEVSWTAPASDGGSAITGYTVTASGGGGQTATTTGATTATVTGLTNGTAYTFTLTTTNATGTSLASTASTAVTPTTGPTPTPTPTPTPGATPTPTATFLPSSTPVGGATVVVGGRTIPPAVTANRQKGTIKVSGGNLQIIVRPKSPGGANLSLDSHGTAILNAGGSVAASGRGGVPGSPVNFFLLRGSTATFLGSLDALCDGTYAGSVPIPSDLARGTYTLQVNGLTNDARPHAVVTRAFSISIRVRVIKPAAKPKAVRTVVYFGVFSAKLTKPAKRRLHALVTRLPTKSTNLVRVVGFAGPGYSNAFVNALSKARAKSVARYLRSQGVRGKYVLRGVRGKSSANATSAQRTSVLVIPRKGT